MDITNQESVVMENEKMSKDEFAKLPALKKMKNNIKSAGIICYACAAITLGSSAFISGGMAWLDIAILIVLGLLIQFKNSFVASIILLAYSIFNCVMGIVLYGMPAGWLIIIAGAYAVYATSKLNKAYKEYSQTGFLPSEEVK